MFKLFSLQKLYFDYMSIKPAQPHTSLDYIAVRQGYTVAKAIKIE